MTTHAIIPSYPYVQFSDDIDIQAWFSAHNQYSQHYLDWMNTTPLAIYTNDNISGSLLDWVANGVYGIYRVPLSNAKSKTYGPLNTYTFNDMPLNQGRKEDISSFQQMDDELFKRVITWDFYKGDGAQFTIPWIKKRVARFIYGINGFKDTTTISVKIPSPRNVVIYVNGIVGSDAVYHQLAELFQNQILNFPYGYSVSFNFVDSHILNDDFGGDIA